MSIDFGTELGQHALDAVRAVIPAAIEVESSASVTNTFIIQEIGVLIGFAGQLPGQMIVAAPQSVFAGISEMMFGMALEGEMLESFVGELGNMIAGNTATNLSASGVVVDISPPTVLVGQTKTTGFQRGVASNLTITGLGMMHLVLMVD